MVSWTKAQEKLCVRLQVWEDAISAMSSTARSAPIIEKNNFKMNVP
jgi:hypothetical protein